MAETVNIDLGGAKPPDRKREQPVSSDLSNLIRDGIVRGLSHKVHSKLGRAAGTAFDYFTRPPAKAPLSQLSSQPSDEPAVEDFDNEDDDLLELPEPTQRPTQSRPPRKRLSREDRRVERRLQRVLGLGRYTGGRWKSKPESPYRAEIVPESPPLPYQPLEETPEDRWNRLRQSAKQWQIDYVHGLDPDKERQRRETQGTPSNQISKASFEKLEKRQRQPESPPVQQPPVQQPSPPIPPSLPPGYTPPSGTSSVTGGFSRGGQPPVAGSPPVGPPSAPTGIPTGAPLPPPAAAGGAAVATGAVVAVGIAIAAVAIKELADAAIAAKKRLDQMAEEYGPYEERLARAMAFAPITRLESDIRRAERAGPQVAKWIDASARNDARVAEAITEAMRPIYPLAADLLDKVTDIVVLLTPVITWIMSFTPSSAKELIDIAITAAAGHPLAVAILLALKGILDANEKLAAAIEPKDTELDVMLRDFLNPGKFITGFVKDRSPSDIGYPSRRGR